jgi:hypothetical protein
MDLLEIHKKMLLEESGIAPEVVEARGYRTIEKKAELKRLGFSEAQCNVPGLLIPVWGPTGIVLYQYRPDTPRIRDGKVIKYETPSGSRMTLDVHPFARDKLGDPSVPSGFPKGLRNATPW